MKETLLLTNNNSNGGDYIRCLLANKTWLFIGDKIQRLIIIKVTSLLVHEEVETLMINGAAVLRMMLNH